MPAFFFFLSSECNALVYIPDRFAIAPLKDQYQLHLGEYTGNAGNAMDASAGPPQEGQVWVGPGLREGIKFSTYDQPDDGEANCIQHSKSGWWFSRYSVGVNNHH